MMEDYRIQAMAKGLRNISTDTHRGIESLRDSFDIFIAPGYWREFDCIGDHWKHDTFEQFCDEWLFFPIDKLVVTFIDEPHIIAIIRETGADVDTHIKAAKQAVEVARARAAMDNELPGHGGARTASKDAEQGDNITLKEGERGTSKTYTLRKLARDRPDLLDRVETGELSANAAAIEAGFRKKTMTVPCDIDGLIEVLKRKFNEEELASLVAGLL